MIRFSLHFFGGRGRESRIRSGDVAISNAFQQYAINNGGVTLEAVTAHDSERGIVSVMSDDLASVEDIARETRSSASRAQDYYTAISGYKGADFDAMRAVQNGNGDQYLDSYRQKMEKQAADAEEYLSKAPRWNGGTTYRGIMLHSGDAHDVFKTGEVIDMKGMSSWSTDRSLSEGFGEIEARSTSKRSVLFINDGQTSGASIDHFSVGGYHSVFGDSQHEVLCSSKARFEITQTIDHGNYLEVRVKEMKIR